MLTDQGRKDVKKDIGEGVRQHDQDTGPEQPVAGGGVLKEELWVVEAQATDREEGEIFRNGFANGLSGGDKRRSDW